MIDSEPTVVLTIAGSDSSAGAGLQADLKTFQSMEVYGLTAVTSVVSEVPGQVSQLQPVEAALLKDQLELLLDRFPVRALKTGLLPTLDLLQVVVEVLSRHPQVRKVVDPVMVATSGDRLMREEAQAYLEYALLPLAEIVTPNLDEAAVFFGRPIETLEAMDQAGKLLSGRWQTAVLMKGGHLRQAEAIDHLYQAGQLTGEFKSAYHEGIETHGTGCTLSAALTAGLGKGAEIGSACEVAKRFVSAAIGQSFCWPAGVSAKSVSALNHSANW